MECVLFDEVPARELSGRLVSTAGALEQRRSVLHRLLADADEGSHDVGRLIGEAAAWSAAVADDLGWRLDFLEQCQVGLPNPVLTRHADGMVEYRTGLRSRADVDNWRAGSQLHDELAQALEDGDGALAKELLDRLDVLRVTPLALAGFASMLDDRGLVGLVDRIDRARELDANDTLWELFNGGENDRWNQLHQQLADIAEQAGGFMTYGAGAQIGWATPDGRIAVYDMRDLLLHSPHELAGLWSADQSLQGSAFTVLGGVLVPGQPMGGQVDPGAVAPAWYPTVQGMAGFWGEAGIDATFNGIDGAVDGGMTMRRPPSPHRPHFSPRVGAEGKVAWLPGNATSLGRMAGRIGQVGMALDTWDVASSAWAAGDGKEGFDRVAAVGAEAAWGSLQVGAETAGAWVGASALGGACASSGFLTIATAGCAAVGGVVGGFVGKQAYNGARSLSTFNPFAGR